MKSTHSNKHQRTQVRYTLPMGDFVRRVLLLLTFLVTGLGNVWGQGITIWKNNGSLGIMDDWSGKYRFAPANNSTGEECYAVPMDIWEKMKTETFYATIKGSDPQIRVTDGWWGVFLTGSDQNDIKPGNNLLEKINEDTYILTVTLAGNPLVKVIDDHHLLFTGLNYSVEELYFAEDDEFLGKAKNPNNPNAKGSFTKDLDDESVGAYPFTLDGVYSNDIKYARIVLCDATGKAIDYDANILKVTYNNVNAKSAGSRLTNGVYVYDGGQNLTKSNISITLNAGSGMMNQYSVKCLLSTETMETGETKEPDWDYEYTYSFTYPFSGETWYEVLGSDILDEQSVSITKNNEIVTFFEKNFDDYNQCGEFGRSWYARWYVVDESGDKQPIVSSYNTENNTWAVTTRQGGDDGNGTDPWPTDRWKTGDKIVWSDNDRSETSGKEEDQGWYIKQVFVCNTRIAAPNGKTLGDYAGCRIVFEVTDDCPYEGANPDNPPAIKLRYVFVIPKFTGELINDDSKGNVIQIVNDRSASSVDVDFAGGASTHTDMPDPLNYARFYLTDNNGNLVNPKGKLSVSSSTACGWSKDGFCVTGSNLALSNIKVTLNTPMEYKLYKVVGVFSTSTTREVEIGGGAKMLREPDWDLEYTYAFTYPTPDTKELLRTAEWQTGIVTPIASVTDPDTEWGISYKELSAEYYVKWYVKKGDEVQPLEKYTGTRGSTWTIDASEYMVSSANEAILTGQSAFLWNVWKKPIFYAPAGMDEFEQVKDCQIFCEIYSSSSDTEAPNAKYVFSLYEGILGKLKSTGKKGGETMQIENTATSVELPLSKAITKWGSTGQVAYARVWVSTVDGTMVDPTNLLVSSGAAYKDTDEDYKTFGYYFTGGGINLGNANLNLEAGAYSQYQVHVALSVDPAIIEEGKVIHEPDYDYVYTFNFSYPWKTKYKTLIYDEVNNSCTPHLLQNWQELAVELNKARTDLANSLYVRWYLTDENGMEIGMSQNGVASPNNNYKYTGNDNKGYYYDNFSASSDSENGAFNKRGDNEEYNPTIYLPVGYTYDQVRVVCVVATKNEGYNATASWSGDPEVQVQYVYTLKTVKDLNSLPFIHYQGEAYRYLKESGEEDEASKYGYIEVEKGTSATNYSWDSEKNEISGNRLGNIRQKVYTVDYYYYAEEGKDIELVLPLQYYRVNDPNSGNKGSSTEPKAYYRWYDYETDLASPYLSKHNNNNQILSERIYNGENRGLFAVKFSVDPNEDIVAANFKPDFSQQQEFLIACDVSRYMDGMDESFQYLIHEPTLSVRYLFHIRPASVIAGDIVNKAKANNKAGETYEGLSAIENKMKNKASDESISILENKGRIVVSLNGNVGDFSLRTQLSDIGHYYVGDKAARRLWWYAYYQDKDGNWWRHLIGDKDYYDKDGYPVKRSQMYQAKYSLEDLNGTWTQISGTSGTASKEINVGDCIQMVACVSVRDDGTTNVNEDMPIIWAELEFIDAKPLEIDSEELKTGERSVGSMKTQYGEPETVLDFNDYSPYGLARPTNSYENYAPVPLKFETAQYGYCYPQLYGFCATNKSIYGWNGYGISPMHGDYMLLKSMNMQGISKDEDWENQSIYSEWWEDTNHSELYDITHERAKGKNATDSEDYGSFLYVDAADEARTIARLEFDAELCSNAKIYYTAYIACMTGINAQKIEQTPPMVRFRVTTDGDTPGERVPVVMFVTGDIKKEVGDSFSHGKWYQVYGHTVIPSEVGLDGSPRHYYVEIDNYCDNTDGADYCIDQIAFYTTNASLQVKQTVQKECDDKSIDLNIYVNNDDITNNNVNKLYWRIYEERQNGDRALTAPELYDNNGKSYGEIEVPNLPDEADIPTEEDFNKDNSTSGYFKGKDGAIYFSLAKKSFALEEGCKYFISVYELNFDPETDTNQNWGKSSATCSVYSEFFVPKAMYVSAVNEAGDAVTEIDAGCSNNKVQIDLKMVLHLPDDSEDEGFKRYEDVHFDYFIGTKEEYNSYQYNGAYLNAAIMHFREKHDAAPFTDFENKAFNIAYTKETLPDIETEYKSKGGYQSGYYEVIYKAVEEGLLYLLCSNDVKLNIDANHSTVLALSVDDCVENTYPICSPLAFSFDVETSAGAPQMALGFDDVEYPAEGYEKQVVRVGMEQLKMMKGTDGNNNYKLHIPVRSYNDKTQENTSGSKLYFPNDFNYLTISAVEQTTDPILKESIRTAAVGKKFAKIEPVAADESPYVNNDRMYLSLDLSECEIDFHEGYEYEVSTSFIDAVDVSVDKPCMGDLFLVIKVVPEFVTWHPQTMGASVYNVNWNKDENWQRSSRAELYKSEDGTQNTVTTAQGGIYKNNNQMELSSVPNTYVPMKFSYVTLLENCHAPNLIEMKVESTGSDKTGGKLLFGDLATATTPKSETGKSEATDFIKYDMLVRYGKHEDGGEGCFGHRKITGKDSNGKDTWEDVGESELEGKVFDVEKFYGNICKEIYFKPRAELVHQHYLTYGKAWVEKELVANKWYLMSAPLKETYAGDMYVPATPIKDYSSDASATVTGRQVTEAFRSITFNPTTYSRTKYPIYQRSWGTKFDSKVYISTEDVFRSDYSANLSYTTWSGDIVEWGHAFNDVDVPYTSRGGFSIRAHKKMQDENALLRLPKDDESYKYYDYNGDEQGAAVSSFNKVNANIGKFVTDGTNDAEITLAIEEAQQMGGYVLVGNPYMASLDMAKFFAGEANPDLTGGYWKVDESGNPSAQLESGYIRPLEAFFVKADNGTIKFTPDMMTDGNVPDNSNSGSRTFAMTAANDRGKSTATVSVGDEAKTVETLFDSNLNDVPMVYTVAEGQAVSINQLTELDKPIAFGVTCAASDEPVAVTFSDIEQLTSGEVYVVDAVTGEQTEVGEGSVFTVQPNDYGRYFLLAGTAGISEETAVQQGIMVSVRGSMVTVTSNEALTLVRALSPDGATVHQDTTASTSVLFTLTPGVYIIKAENAAGEQLTVKVMVRFSLST